MRYFVIIFSVILVAFFTSQVFAEAHQPNPDSIPFAPPVNYSAGSNPICVFCADLDGDGDLDMAVANWGSGNVSILKNNGDGTFVSAVNYEAGYIPISVFCGDLDGDGDPDLAVANYGSNNVSILKNNGDGTFASAVNYGVGDGPRSIFCADLDGDGDLDLAVANFGSNNVSILKNNGDGTFQSAVNYGAGYGPHSVFCADLDGDTDLDLAVANYNSDNISILKNNGDGTFASAVNYGAGDGPGRVFCADLDGDTDLDLAVANANSNVSILKNNGDGTFASAVNYQAGDEPTSVFCVDLDGDTDLDLAVANWSSANVSILKNNGDGTFASAVNYGAGDHPGCVFCADLDGDTDLDLVVANYGSDNVSILLNLSNFPPTITAPDSSLFLCAADTIKFIVTATDLNPTDTLTLFGSGMAAPVTGVSPLSAEVSIYVSSPGIHNYVYTVTDSWGATDIDTSTWNITMDNIPTVTVPDSSLFFCDPDTIRFTVRAVDLDAGDTMTLTGPGIDTYLQGFSFLSVGIKAYICSTGTYNFVYIVTDTCLNSDQDTATWNVIVNTPPDPFSLNSPLEADTVRMPITFNWQASTDSCPKDTVRYDLYLSRSIGFHPDSTLVYDSLLETHLTDSPGNKLWYWKVKAFDKYGAERWSDQTRSFYAYMCGDCNTDGIVDIGDVIYLINYLYKDGPVPVPLAGGDVTGGGEVDVGDIVYMINYLFKGGHPPCEP